MNPVLARRAGQLLALGLLLGGGYLLNDHFTWRRVVFALVLWLLSQVVFSLVGRHYPDPEYDPRAGYTLPVPPPSAVESPSYSVGAVEDGRRGGYH